MHEDQPPPRDAVPEVPKEGWCYDDYRQWRSEHAWRDRWAQRRRLGEEQDASPPDPERREPPAEEPPG